LNDALCAGPTSAYINDLRKFDGSEWTWLGGSSSPNHAGVYGTLGQSAAASAPGARCGAVSWTDPDGNLWLFGGQGCDSTADCSGPLNNLWEYSGGQWTWVSGFSVSNPAHPGVYAALDTPAPANVPGGRYSATGWIDHSGNLWIYCGLGCNIITNGFAELDDFLEFSSGDWVWRAGSDSLSSQPGTYGTEGTPAPGNLPGARDAAASWTDANGNLWLFSGDGMPGTGLTAAFNDLWEYSAGHRTWVGGYNTGKQAGVYGTLGLPAPANIAGARMGAVAWVDAKGNLWLFGGLGLPATSSGGLGAQIPESRSGYLNDLWVYQPQ